jgi:hypothetical protein
VGSDHPGRSRTSHRHRGRPHPPLKRRTLRTADRHLWLRVTWAAPHATAWTAPPKERSRSGSRGERALPETPRPGPRYGAGDLTRNSSERYCGNMSCQVVMYTCADVVLMIRPLAWRSSGVVACTTCTGPQKVDLERTPVLGHVCGFDHPFARRVPRVVNQKVQRRSVSASLPRRGGKRQMSINLKNIILHTSQQCVRTEFPRALCVWSNQ